MSNSNFRFVLRTVLLALLPTAALAAAFVVAIGGQSVWPANAIGQTSHRVVILVDSDDEKVMGHAISYSMNITRAYAERHERVAIEVVANGSGIRLLRSDTSSLKQPLAMLRDNVPDIVLSMCDSSRRIAEQREGHAIEVLAGARLVPFGIARLVELQEAGWSYIHG